MQSKIPYRSTRHIYIWSVLFCLLNKDYRSSVETFQKNMTFLLIDLPHLITIKKKLKKCFTGKFFIDYLKKNTPPSADTQIYSKHKLKTKWSLWVRKKRNFSLGFFVYRWKKVRKRFGNRICPNTTRRRLFGSGDTKQLVWISQIAWPVNFYLWSLRLKNKNKNETTGVSWGRGRILAGTARILVTWFSQYSGSKVQNFANIDHFWHAILPDWCMLLA